MIKGIDLTNVDSRRAFPTDSRATWVESVHSGSDKYVVGKDNRVLGPGEYTPSLQTPYTKHVPGPLIGGSRGIVDHFHPFRSLLSLGSPGKSAKNAQGFGESQITFEDSDYTFGKAAPVYSIANDISRDTYKKEGATIFHEHDRRMAIDPNQRRGPTPGCYLNHESLLRSTSTFAGVRTLPATVKMGPDDIPYGERMEVRPAAPGDYRPDKSLDSRFMRKRTQQSKISPADRKTYFDLQARAIEVQAGVCNMAQDYKEKRSIKEEAAISDMAMEARAEAEYRRDRISKIRMPKLRTRLPPSLVFDAKCYKDAMKEASDLALHPASLKREAKIDLFSEYLTLPRKHQGHRVPSRLSDKVKRSVL